MIAHSRTDRIVGFLQSAGLAVRLDCIAFDTFLPGVTVVLGVLVVDEERLLYPGDLLHEAGHLAMLTPEERAEAGGDMGDDGGMEMAAIAWSYAAAVHLGIEATVLFHTGGYRGGAEALAANFAAGRYVGVPMLEWAGLTTCDTYPRMSGWARE
jgi:hypothetical protein